MSTLIYKGKTEPGEQKLRGGYYTPIKLTDYLVRWALRKGGSRILEPSAGDGNFVVSVLNYSKALKSQYQMTAIEIVSGEIEKAQSRVLELNGSNNNINWLCNDFFEAYTDLIWQEKFDVIIGNPPFIRFQHFDDTSRSLAFKYLEHAGYKPTKLANVWSAFVQLSIELLKEGGKLAFVVPAELLQVNYAKELRTRLSRQFDHIVIVGFKKLVFPEIQQEVVLLLAEGKRLMSGAPSDIHTIEFEDGEDLLHSGDLRNTIAHVASKHSRNGMKWTSLFLSDSAFQAIDEAEQSSSLIPLGKLAQVDVGIVTGRNSFFVLSAEKMRELKAGKFTTPIIGRTSALSSISFTPDDFESYQEKYPAFLLDLRGHQEKSLPKEILDYIKDGEREKVHTGYKCRIRQRWYDVPSVYVPDAFLFRQIHKYPLLVVNDARVSSTDTIHRVRLHSGVDPKLLAAVMYNSFTLAWAEVCGRSYGGGVLELEPREAEELPIPYDDKIKISPSKVDTLLRYGKDTDALDYVDGIVLKNHLGFSQKMIGNFRSAWHELKNRRTNRR